MSFHWTMCDCRNQLRRLTFAMHRNSFCLPSPTISLVYVWSYPMVGMHKWLKTNNEKKTHSILFFFCLLLNSKSLVNTRKMQMIVRTVFSFFFFSFLHRNPKGNNQLPVSKIDKCVCETVDTTIKTWLNLTLRPICLSRLFTFSAYTFVATSTQTCTAYTYTHRSCAISH